MAAVEVAAPLGRAARIAALRHLVCASTSIQSAQLLSGAQSSSIDQAIAYKALARSLRSSTTTIGFVREASPRAWFEHERVVRDAASIGRFPWGAERSVVYASTAILFESEADALGDRIRPTLLRPVIAVFGDERAWIELAAAHGISDVRLAGYRLWILSGSPSCEALTTRAAASSAANWAGSGSTLPTRGVPRVFGAGR